MRRLWPALVLLTACNANPLLHEVSSDYAPVKAGQVWTYQEPSGALFVRSVGAPGPWNGRQAYPVAQSDNGVDAGTLYWSFDGGDWLQWDATLGWILYRRLPYVPGNSWSVPTTITTRTVLATVDGTENLALQAYYANCFKIRRQTYDYDPLAGVTTSTQTLDWAAPGVGDVKEAQVDVSGTTTVLGELIRYQAP